MSIEQDAEGAHHLERAHRRLAVGDDDRLRDEAVTERGVAAAIDSDQVREVADLDFEGSAHTAALDLANLDGRFAPDVLEASARRALASWVEAVDGEDAALEAVATPEAVQAMLYPKDPSRRNRLVVRGPKLRKLRIVEIDAAADPPAMLVEAEVAGRRYIEDRNTTTVVWGRNDVEEVFFERWLMVLTDDAATPWRIAQTDVPPSTISRAAAPRHP